MITLDEIFNNYFPSEFGVTEEDSCIKNFPKFLLNRVGETVCGVSKFVIFLNEDTVIKIPFNGMFFWDCEKEDYYFEPFWTSDYCAKEEEIYNDAVNEGLEEFFAKTEYIGTNVSGKAIYQSERVILYESAEGRKIATSTPPSKKAIDEANEIINRDEYYYTSLPFGWLARAYDFYEKEKVDRLVNFIDKLGLQDFHDGNIGFRKNGAPVLLDYSDYDG